MDTTAYITIYLQALGGKFLGPNAYNHQNIEVSITVNKQTKKVDYVLAENGNDGGIGTSFLYDLPSALGQSSFMPILTPTPEHVSNPAVNYLTPNNLTICGKAEVTLSEPTVLATVTANIPRPQGGNLVLTQDVALNQLQTNYRVTMVAPGLLLDRIKTPTPPKNTIYLFVRMMCGCPITTPSDKTPNPYWLPSDFLVSAEVILQNYLVEHHGVTFTSSDTPSLFQLAVNSTSDVRHVNFTARQKSTNNVGYLSVDGPF